MASELRSLFYFLIICVDIWAVREGYVNGKYMFEIRKVKEDMFTKEK